MHAWLQVQFGRRGFWVGSEAGAGFPDAVLVYFLDVPSALAFVERFRRGTITVAPGPQGSAPP